MSISSRSERHKCLGGIRTNCCQLRFTRKQPMRYSNYHKRYWPAWTYDNVQNPSNTLRIALPATAPKPIQHTIPDKSASATARTATADLTYFFLRHSATISTGTPRENLRHREPTNGFFTPYHHDVFQKQSDFFSPWDVTAQDPIACASSRRIC